MHSASLDTRLRSTARRVGWISVGRAASIGLAAAIVLVLIAWTLRWPFQAVVVGSICVVAAAIALRYGARARVFPGAVDAARMIEHRADHHNLLVTAAEISALSRAATPVESHVLKRAADAFDVVDVRALFPRARGLLVLIMLMVAWAGTVAAMMRYPGSSPVRRAAAIVAPSMRVSYVDVTVTPPAYMQLPARTVHDPARIEAPAGSTIAIMIATSAPRADIETIDGRSPMADAGTNRFEATVRADADGYVAVGTRDATGNAADRRMIGVAVTPDAAPRVRITKPTRDLHINDSTATIEVALDADDDIGLTNLTLRYTRVSGSGEQFAFTEGTVPVRVTKTDAHKWSAHTSLSLAPFTLAKGDMIVLRAAAADARPNAAPSLSDAFIVEVIAPGSEPLAGFAADDGSDRYALSQEMVIQKTQQLIRTASGMTPDSLRDAAMQLAAEQRAVRAEFVFMMGGELAEEVIDAAAQSDLNEEAEAAGESDLAAGRGVNKSRIALVDAIRAMSQANTALTSIKLDEGLAAERRALASLQSAFSHTRYILRGLTQHERLDLARRLTGDITGARGETRAPAMGAESERVHALRASLVSTSLLLAEIKLDRAASKRAATLSASVARIAPSDTTVVRAATLINEAAAAMLGGEDEVARARLRSAVARLTALVRLSTPDALPLPVPPSLKPLDGALNDALNARRIRGRR